MSLFEINVTINAPELVGAINNLAEAFKGGISVTKEDTKLDKASQKVKAVADKKTTKIVEVPEKDEPAEQEQPETESEDAIQEEYTLEDVRAALKDLADTKGKEAAKGVLTALGVKSVSNLQPEQFAEAMQLVKEA